MILITNKVCRSFSFMSVWLALTIPFYFGQILFHGYYDEIGYLRNIRSVFNGIFSGQTILTTCFFTLDCLIVMCISFCEVYSRRNKIARSVKENAHGNSTRAEVDLKNMKIVATVLFVATILPTIYYWVYAATVNSALGYVEMKSITRTVSKNSLVYISSYLSGWFLPAAYMLLISCKSKYGRWIAKLSLALVALLIFRAGSRYKAVEIFVAYLLIDLYWLNKGKKADIKKYAIIMSIVLIASVLVRFERIGLDFSGASRDVIGAVLGDTGSTIMINCAAIKFIPSDLPFGNGISFLNGFLAILPGKIRNIFFPNHQMDITGTVLTQLCGVTWSNFGSSIIAEGYYNLGYFSLILMFVYGILMGEIVNIQKNSIGLLSPCRFIVYVYICSEFVFAIRSEFTSSIRGVVVLVLLPLAIVKLLGISIRNKAHLH